MLLSIRIKNYKTFKNEIEMSFMADMRIKRFVSNTIEVNNHNVLKTAGIYGPNNTGKSCLIEALYSLRLVMLNQNSIEFYNSFYDNHITEFEVVYEINSNIYRYIVHYDSSNLEYVYEKLEKVINNDYNNFTYEKVFSRSKDKIDINALNINRVPISLLNNKIPIFMMLSLKDTKLEEVQRDYISFANSIKMINMELPIEINKTLSLLQKDPKANRFITSFAKNCDLNIQDFGYSSDVVSDVDISKKVSKYFNDDIAVKEILKIWSKHHNHVVPSVLFDSVGTRKIIALAGYIYDLITNGGVLLIDELDSSLHHTIIRAIIALFNNMLNEKAQLVFSTHDALTMDLRKLFRKDQIFLTDIDDNGDNVLIHLSEKFTARDENGIRGNEDITEYYLKGRFGGVPSPDLFDSIYEVLKDE